ncbi:MAG: NAD(P)-binding domain-containing protein [Planctomycetaceae bacterium]
MCGHLLDAGYSATVYNRTREKSEDLLQKGAQHKEADAYAAGNGDDAPGYRPLRRRVISLCPGNVD